MHSVDDPASRMLKMLQQKKIALKRQRDVSNNAFRTGVTPQLDTPLEAMQLLNRAHGWEKMLQVPLDDAVGLVRVVVPPNDDAHCQTVTTTACGSSIKTSLHAAGDLCSEKKTTCHGMGSQDEPCPTTKRKTLAEAAMEDCWDLSKSKAQEKIHGHHFQRPWGQREEKIVEEKRVSLPAVIAEDVAEHRNALAIRRTSTPWQPCHETDLLEESINSDISSIFDFVSEKSEDFSAFEPTSVDIDTEHIDGDNDSNDSGIERSVSEWKLQEKASPHQSRSRLNRFIPNLQASKLWRSLRTTRTAVTPLVVEID